MTKVALVNPGKGVDNATHEPLNLGFIASYLLKNGVDVKIIDQLAGQNVKKSIKKYNPDIVGITGTTAVIYEAYKIADMCKEMGIPTVIGGVHVSVLTNEALKRSDIVIKGEGERAMLKVVKEGVKKGIVQSEYIKDLNEIPHPARHLMDMNFYAKTKDRSPGTHLHFVKPHTRTCAIIAQRGCPYQCIFCHNSWRGLPVRFHSAEFIVEEMRQVIDRYNIKAIFFMDDDFLAHRRRTIEFCELIKKEGIDIEWGCQTRVVGLDLKILKMIKEAGCKQVTFGLESGSQRILEILKNGKTTVEQNKEAIRLCKEASMLACGTFMIGSPSETVRDIRMTQQFIRENPIDGVGVHMTTAFPGTELWEMAKAKGLIPKKINWNDFNTGKFTINLCDTISKEKLNQLYHETIEIAMGINRSSSIGNIMKIAARHPLRSIKAVASNPKKVLRLVSRTL